MICEVESSRHNRIKGMCSVSVSYSKVVRFLVVDFRWKYGV